MKKMIIASTSTVFGSGYLDYLLPVLQVHFKNVNTVFFMPYAMPGGLCYDAYTEIVSKVFSKINIEIKGIHEYKSPKEAILSAEAIFIGGGNTFELVNQLYKHDLLNNLKLIIERGIPYLGTSAGSNICGVDMKNTNDMPIVYPPSFKTLGCLSFNINAHYLDPDKDSTHMGESRETRIKEFHVFNETSVLGLREGSWLSIENNKIILQGEHTARLFLQNQDPMELQTGIEVVI
jgi:dipeptidase E